MDSNPIIASRIQNVSTVSPQNETSYPQEHPPFAHFRQRVKRAFTFAIAFLNFPKKKIPPFTNTKEPSSPETNIPLQHKLRLVTQPPSSSENTPTRPQHKTTLSPLHQKLHELIELSSSNLKTQHSLEIEKELEQLLSTSHEFLELLEEIHPQKTLSPQHTPPKPTLFINPQDLLQKPLVSTLKASVANILFIDESREYTTQLKPFLQQHQYAIYTISDLSEADSFLSSPQCPKIIDLVILSPLTLNTELCNKINHTKELRKYRILHLITTKSSNNLPENFHTTGHDTISTPCHTQALLGKIQNHISINSAQQHLQTLQKLRRRLQSLKTSDLILEHTIQHLKYTGFIDHAIITQHSSFPSLSYQKRQNTSQKLSEHPWFKHLTAQHSHSGQHSFESYLSHYTKVEPHPLSPQQSIIFLKPNTPYTFLESLYIQTLLSQCQENTLSESPIIDATLITALSKIQPIQKKVIYIKSKAPYCEIFLDGNSGLPDTVRISLKRLEQYFQNEPFVRVHESYIINKHKVVNIQRLPKQKYHHIDLKGTHTKIPIGPSYFSSIQEKYMHLL